VHRHLTRRPPPTGGRRGLAGDRTRRARHDVLTRHSRNNRRPTGLVNHMTSATPTTDNPFGLVVLDMAGTTVADGGLVEQAFSAAAERLGVKPGSGEHERQLSYVRATMGESKISVFRHLFGEEEKAQYANTAFEEAYGALVD